MPLLHGGIFRIGFSLALVDIIQTLVAYGHSCRKISTCAKENPILKILPCRKVTFHCSKWKFTLEKGQNWSLCSFKFAYWIDTFLSFTSKIWSKLRNSIILAFIQRADKSHLLKWWFFCQPTDSESERGPYPMVLGARGGH